MFVDSDLSWVSSCSDILGLLVFSAQVGAQPNTFGIPGVDKYGRRGEWWKYAAKMRDLK